MNNQISTRINQLRSFMKDKNLQAFIVPSTDAHMSEYIPEYWEARKWISGFTGSAGTVVITLNKAGLWTDSRYFLQAESELSGSEIVLFKDRLPETIRISDWLLQELMDGDRVGIDGHVYSAKDALSLSNELKESNITLISDYDPFDIIWQERPVLPKTPIVVHPMEFAGETVSRKITRVLAEAEKVDTNAVWISSLDTIAWLFNIRGHDVFYNPVVVSHAYLSKDENVLFVDKEKISLKVAEHLQKERVTIADYHETGDFLKKICNMQVCVDGNKISFNLYQAITERNWIVDTLSVADVLKSMKNEVEVAGFRRAMVRDGVALVKFLMWLEKNVSEKNDITEYTIGLQLKAFRGEQEHFSGESFSTIAGYGANAAVVHYHPLEDSASQIKPEGFLLIDSGGQYLDGTTDITRTVALGALTDEMKNDYTLVLKGHIGLSKAVFPAGTRGSQIDLLARKAMWEQGINYLHGTGHGVGHYLNVHEGPQSIRPEENPVAMRVGMVVTNEPGIYRDHRYGIRIENMMLTQLAMHTEYGDFYSFETITLCPIDTTPIVKSMLTDDDRVWLNEYHGMVYERLSPYLSDSEREWLKHKTDAI